MSQMPGVSSQVMPSSEHVQMTAHSEYRALQGFSAFFFNYYFAVERRSRHGLSRATSWSFRLLLHGVISAPNLYRARDLARRSYTRRTRSKSQQYARLLETDSRAFPVDCSRRCSEAACVIDSRNEQPVTLSQKATTAFRVVGLLPRPEIHKPAFRNLWPAWLELSEQASLLEKQETRNILPQVVRPCEPLVLRTVKHNQLTRTNKISENDRSNILYKSVEFISQR